MAELFGKTIEGGPPDPGRRQRMEALGGRLVTLGGLVGGSLINGSGVPAGHESQTSSPEYVQARAGLVRTIREVLDACITGQFRPETHAMYSPPEQRPGGSRMEQWVISGDIARRTPEVTFGLNRPAALVLLEERNSLSTVATEKLPPTMLIASYAVKGVTPAGTVNYRFDVREQWAQWCGFSELDFADDDPRRWTRRIERVEPLVMATEEIRRFAGLPTVGQPAETIGG